MSGCLVRGERVRGERVDGDSSVPLELVRIQTNSFVEKNMRILPVAEAKAKLSQLVTEVASKDEEITITRNGRAAAVLLSYEEFESWKETADILADPEFAAEIQKGVRDLKKGRGRVLGTGDLDRLFATAPARKPRGK